MPSSSFSFLFFSSDRKERRDASISKGTLLPSNLFGLCKGKRRDESNDWLGCVKGREEGNDKEQLQGHTRRGGSTPTPWKVRLDSVLLGVAHHNQPQHDSCHQERQQQEPV
nr:uncharacterized protein LOC109733128 [Aegilops tauschii subsp. strangulata]